MSHTRNHRRQRRGIPTTTKVLLLVALAVTASFVAFTVQEPDRKEVRP